MSSKRQNVQPLGILEQSLETASPGLIFNIGPVVSLTGRQDSILWTMRRCHLFPLQGHVPVAFPFLEEQTMGQLHLLLLALFP